MTANWVPIALARAQPALLRRVGNGRFDGAVAGGREHVGARRLGRPGRQLRARARPADDAGSVARRVVGRGGEHAPRRLDRICMPAPWTRTIDELIAGDVGGDVYAHELVTAPRREAPGPTSTRSRRSASARWRVTGRAPSRRCDRDARRRRVRRHLGLPRPRHLGRVRAGAGHRTRSGAARSTISAPRGIAPSWSTRPSRPSASAANPRSQTADIRSGPEFARQGAQTPGQNLRAVDRAAMVATTAGLPWSRSEADQERALAIGRRRAGLLLVVVTLVFLATIVANAESGSLLGYVQATAEASMVGGLADWFAVTALFRHPLGIPIPHTAIIPERKEKFGATLGEFVQDNFLTPDALVERVRPSRVVEPRRQLAGDTGERRAVRRATPPTRPSRSPTSSRTTRSTASLEGIVRDRLDADRSRAARGPGPRDPHRRRAATRSSSTPRCVGLDRYLDEHRDELRDAVRARGAVVAPRARSRTASSTGSLDGARTLLDDMVDRPRAARCAASSTTGWRSSSTTCRLARAAGPRRAAQGRPPRPPPAPRPGSASRGATSRRTSAPQADDPDSELPPAARATESPAAGDRLRDGPGAAANRPRRRRGGGPLRGRALPRRDREPRERHDRAVGRRGDRRAASSCCSAPTCSSSASTEPSSAAPRASASTR